MKMKLWMTFAVMIATSVLADSQPGTNAAPPVETPAPAPAIAPPPAESAASNAPAAKPAKKASAKKPAAKKAPVVELKTVPLVPGLAVVAVSPNSRVMVRGRAGLAGEILARMTNGQRVTVIEETTLKKSQPDEPSVWAKIALPEQAHAWVRASYIDATNKTVKPKKLNLRGGPGENYSIVGELHRGDAVKEIKTTDEWMQIEPPAGSYAFMAAPYLTQDPAILAASEPPSIAAVTETPPIAVNTTETPVVTPPPVEPAMTNEAPAEPAPPVEEPPQPRIVQREGLVRGTFSVQAPTHFELISADNHRTINYLYTTSTNLDLSRYKGLHIIVTGEGGLDERWKNTPIITIQRIVVLE